MEDETNVTVQGYQMDISYDPLAIFKSNTWCAWTYEGEHTGYGATKEEAIEDALDKLPRLV